VGGETKMLDKQINILLVDDELEIRTILYEMLQLEGFNNIIRAKDGEEAIEKIKDNNIDLVISDIKMPRMDGIELLNYVHDHLEKIPFIFISGFCEMIDPKEAFSKGVVAFIKKPFSLGVVLEEMDKVYAKIEGKREEQIELHPFPLDEIHVLRHFDIAIFLKLENDKIIEFADNASLINEEKIQTLQEKGIDHLFIETDDYHMVLKSLNAQKAN
jgi:YesN/AraC family two-component response regulator